MRQDSVTYEAPLADELPIEIVASEPKTLKPKHPYQVLRMLPKNATPAQQDSAIQATFQPDEIPYSQQPDTLHLPGHTAGVNLREVNLPQYYRENFFSNDTLLHAELHGGRYGMAGDPIPYSMRNDNIITCLLLALFVIVLISAMQSKRFIVRQVKSFFYEAHSENVSVIPETSGEMYFQVFLVIVTSLLLSLLQYSYAQHYVAQTFILSSEYHLIAIYFGVILSYFLLRSLLYTIVNSVFFDGKKNTQWMKTLLFVTSSEGIFLFPVVLLQVYFDLALESVIIYFTFVLVLVKLLTFYKCYSIFFRQIPVFLQIFLYFCALEIIPLTSLLGVLGILGNYLKVNF